MIRKAITATAETSCDGAVAAALVLGGWRSSWAGVELVFAEELELFCRIVFFVIRLVFVFVYVSIRLVSYSATYSVFSYVI